MKLGVVFPHNEIGTDPIAIRDYAQGAEALGADHILTYDHVLGADPDRPGGWSGPYDKDVAFHEPFTLFAFMAAATSRIGFCSCVMILPQRQTALVAKQAAQLAILSGNRFRLGIGTGWNEVEYEVLGRAVRAPGRTPSGTGRTAAPPMDRGQPGLPRRVPHRHQGEHPAPTHRAGADLVRRRRTRPAQALRQTGRRLGAHRRPQPKLPRRPRDDPFGKRGRRTGLGRLRRPGPGANPAAGIPDRWKRHHDRWRDLGATHLAIVTHYMGHGGDVDAHLKSAETYFRSVRG